MKSPKFLFLILSLFILAGCGSGFAPDRSPKAAANQRVLLPLTLLTKIGERWPERKLSPAQVSLAQADQSQSLAEAMNRKIIRNAELTIEVDAPADAQRKISSIAESLGGFVVTSESKTRQLGDGKQELEVNLVVRVPATAIRNCSRPNPRHRHSRGRGKNNGSGRNRGVHRSRSSRRRRRRPSRPSFWRS